MDISLWRNRSQQLNDVRNNEWGSWVMALLVTCVTANKRNFARLDKKEINAKPILLILSCSEVKYYIEKWKI